MNLFDHIKALADAQLYEDVKILVCCNFVTDFPLLISSRHAVLSVGNLQLIFCMKLNSSVGFEAKFKR